LSGPVVKSKLFIINSLIEKYSDIFEVSISYTTRMPRIGEIHGKHYFFVNKEEFENEIKKDNFV